MSEIKEGDIVLVRYRKIIPTPFFVSTVKSVGKKVSVKNLRLDKEKLGVDFWIFLDMQEAEQVCAKLNGAVKRHKAEMAASRISFEESITQITSTI